MSAQQSACAGAVQYRNKFPCNLGGAVVAQSGFGRISGDRKAPPETKLFHSGSPHAAAMPSLIDKDGHIAKRAKITPAPPATTTLSRAVLGVLLRQDAVADELVQTQKRLAFFYMAACACEAQAAYPSQRCRAGTRQPRRRHGWLLRGKLTSKMLP